MFSIPHTPNVLAQIVPIWTYTQLVPALFVFAFGACMGSFINVVAYRLPMRQSIITPPSRCPTCGARLSWRENFPILGWLALRGKCRSCGVRIRPHYLLIEIFVGLLLSSLYLAYFASGPNTVWFNEVGGPWWSTAGPLLASPAFIAHIALVSGLVALTLIDARTFLIPLQIPLIVTAIAFLAWPIQAVMPTGNGYRTEKILQHWPPIPNTGWALFLLATGAMLGVFIALILLRRGILRYSFADYEQYLKDDEPLADYPHARREMFVELHFLLPIVLGGVLGWVFWWLIQPAEPPPPVVGILGATLLGYLVGGGIVWIVRILGTLAFGREALGAGDIHLLACVGAVLGWEDAIWVFMIAPFPALAWHLIASVVTKSDSPSRELPYGPYIAAATLLVMFCRPLLNDLRDYLFMGFANVN